MLTVERLENRCVLSCMCDVNLDTKVTAQDALIVINALLDGAAYEQRLDTNRDAHVSPVDILVIVNDILHQPKLPVPKTMFRVQIMDADTVGFTEQQVRDAIDAAFDEFGAIADVGVTYTSINPQVRVTTYELYLGNGQHARGWYAGNGLIGLHDGIIAPYHHSGRNGPINQTLYYKAFDSQAAIQQIFGHEFMHWLGWEHSGDPTCRMHSNAPPGFCASERTWWINTYGTSQR